MKGRGGEERKEERREGGRCNREREEGETGWTTQSWSHISSCCLPNSLSIIIMPKQICDPGYITARGEGVRGVVRCVVRGVVSALVWGVDKGAVRSAVRGVVMGVVRGVVRGVVKAKLGGVVRGVARAWLGARLRGVVRGSVRDVVMGMFNGRDSGRG